VLHHAAVEHKPGSYKDGKVCCVYNCHTMLCACYCIVVIRNAIVGMYIY
jgi:hypothetical protein